MDPFELLAHPVRLRIIHAMRGDRTLTTTGLCALLPDVSKATVYRHVDVLAAAGVLHVAEERRVRGAVERHYRLRTDRAAIGADVAAAATPADHRAVFATAMAVLVAEFHAYLDRDDADPARDAVGYRQHALWLSPAERDALITGLRDAILPHLAHPPTDRSRYLLSPVLFPLEHPAPP
ncbi:Helix-turn-helix domain-containing protein [Actinacidiphila rubida]|uniref:Helix-turn-helix domain-containing protein n=1 Tax=Actinacidiphila rubida TaxID=310780 RepID=A0A1H8T7T4_9ACTN|nr:helix-turn-helix domain-containing protein [Actinacidiphila rubida]SEO86992.1 Helix-turn-helix domain-containing protein [Actinacidiphila rubida]